MKVVVVWLKILLWFSSPFFILVSLPFLPCILDEFVAVYSLSHCRFLLWLRCCVYYGFDAVSYAVCDVFSLVFFC